MSIDWNKAPEGATHVSDDGFEFYRPAKNNRGGEYFDPGREAWVILVDDFEHVIDGAVERPRAWNGQGLPPVGTVCRFCGGESDPIDPWHPALRDGAKVTVIAHYNNMGADVAVFTFADQRKDVTGMQVDQAMAQCFRPLRTPEQIAAEERNEAIGEMLDGLSGSATYGDIAHRICAQLYDAGFRKVTP